MVNDEMGNTNKEFFVKRVEKYNNESKSLNTGITIGIIGIGVGAIYVAWNLLGPMPESPLVRNLLHISIATGLYPSIGGLIINIAKKMGINIRINEIEEILEHYGFNLEDELSKDKGKR